MLRFLSYQGFLDSCSGYPEHSIPCAPVSLRTQSAQKGVRARILRKSQQSLLYRASGLWPVGHVHQLDERLGLVAVANFGGEHLGIVQIALAVTGSPMGFAPPVGKRAMLIIVMANRAVVFAADAGPGHLELTLSHFFHQVHRSQYPARSRSSEIKRPSKAVSFTPCW